MNAGLPSVFCRSEQFVERNRRFFAADFLPRG
jgi:hypothetical protein